MLLELQSTSLLVTRRLFCLKIFKPPFQLPLSSYDSDRKRGDDFILEPSECILWDILGDERRPLDLGLLNLGEMLGENYLNLGERDCERTFGDDFRRGDLTYGDLSEDLGERFLGELKSYQGDNFVGVRICWLPYMEFNLHFSLLLILNEPKD